MGIVDTISGAMTQTAVYWGSPIPDGTGTYTYDGPVEIDCRWEEKSEVVNKTDGEEIVSFAQVFINQDVDENGFLFLGGLDDLDSADEVEPIGVYGAFRISKFEKFPEYKTTNKFLRKAYL